MDVEGVVMLDVYLMVYAPSLPPPHTAPTPERFAYRKSELVNNLIIWILLHLSLSLSLSSSLSIYKILPSLDQFPS